MAAVYVEYEKVFLEKCARSLPLGVRVCNYLKATPYKVESGILGNVFDGSQAKQLQFEKEDRFRKLIHEVEIRTSRGKNLPAKYMSLRADYYKDLNFLLEIFSRLGDQLRNYPSGERNYHLRKAINEINAIVANRILSRGTGKREKVVGPRHMLLNSSFLSAFDLAFRFSLFDTNYLNVFRVESTIISLDSPLNLWD